MGPSFTAVIDWYPTWPIDLFRPISVLHSERERENDGIEIGFRIEIQNQETILIARLQRCNISIVRERINLGSMGKFQINYLRYRSRTVTVPSFHK